jgi:hypothetical protein
LCERTSGPVRPSPFDTPHRVSARLSRKGDRPSKRRVFFFERWLGPPGQEPRFPDAVVCPKAGRRAGRWWAPMNANEPHRRSQVAPQADLEQLRPVKVRQGFTLGHMRYVLGISVALVVVAFAIIYFLNF